MFARTSTLFLILLSGSILASNTYATPTTPPPNGYTGGVFSQYFQNIVNFNGGTGICPGGQGIVGFNTGSTAFYGTPICQSMSLAPGAQGQTLMYNGSNWVATSNVFHSGTNVGIGTSTPTTKLEVNGTVKVSSGSISVDNGGVYINSPSPLMGNLGAWNIMQSQMWLSNGGYKATSLATRNLDGAFAITVYNAGDGLGGVGGPALASVWKGGAPDFIIKRSGNVGIGVDTPTAKLEVNGQVKITGGSPGTNKVLTSDASGLASWQDIAGDWRYSVLPISAEDIFIKKGVTQYAYIGGEANVALVNGVGTQFGQSVSLGYKAMPLSLGGGYNSVAIGYRALYSSTGSANTAIGAMAGMNLSSGSSSNVFIGATAGRDHKSGSNNIFIGGYTSASSNTASNQLNIGNWIYGDNGNIGIGVVTPTAKLEVAGDIKNTGNIIVNNVSPTLYLQDTDHRSAMVHVNNNRFYILRGATTNSMGWSATGSRWPLDIDLENNYAVFGGAGDFGGGIRVPGFQGSYGNTSNGYSFSSPGDTDGGLFSPADGTLVLVTDASEKMRINNIGEVSIGGDPLYGKFTVRGRDDIATFVSPNTNAYIRLAVNNDINSRLELANRNGRTALWNAQTGDSFNILHSNGNVGIGIISPRAKLDVVGEIASELQGVGQFRAAYGSYGSIWRNDSSNTYFLHTNPGDPYGGWNNDRQIILPNNSDNVYLSNNNGMVGIGTTAPTEKLEVNGNIKATAFIYSSDRQLKSDITPLASSLDRLVQLNGYSFVWKETGKKDIGIIAQEVEKVFPEIVHTNTHTGLKSVEYGNLVAPIIEAIKTIQNHNNERDNRVQQLEKENASLRARLDAIEQRLGY